MSRSHILRQELASVLPNESEETIVKILELTQSASMAEEDGSKSVSVSFGAGSNIGDIIFRDIAGRDIVKVTNNYLNNNASIDPSYIIATLEDGMNKLTDLIKVFHEKTIIVTNETTEFTARIAAISDKLSLTQPNSLDESMKDKIEATISTYAHSLLMYANAVEAIIRSQQSAMAISEFVLQRFLKQDLLQDAPPEDKAIELIVVLLDVEAKILSLKRRISEAVIQLRGLTVSKRAFERSNTSVSACIEGLQRFSAVTDDDLHLTWRVIGTIQGYMRTITS